MKMMPSVGNMLIDVCESEGINIYDLVGLIKGKSDISFDHLSVVCNSIGERKSSIVPGEGAVGDPPTAMALTAAVRVFTLAYYHHRAQGMTPADDDNFPHESWARGDSDC